MLFLQQLFKPVQFYLFQSCVVQSWKKMQRANTGSFGQLLFSWAGLEDSLTHVWGHWFLEFFALSPYKLDLQLIDADSLLIYVAVSQKSLIMPPAQPLCTLNTWCHFTDWLDQLLLQLAPLLPPIASPFKAVFDTKQGSQEGCCWNTLEVQFTSSL